MEKTKHPNNFIDLTGKNFYNWHVIEYGYKNEKHQVFWKCKCNCGKEKYVNGVSLREGKSKSCGNHKHDLNRNRYKTHGKSSHPLFPTWRNMIRRCYDNRNEEYKWYGRRGIKVCERWKNVINFIDDLKFKPLNTSLDRINNNLNYSCGKCEECLNNKWILNCKWSTQKEQTRNTRRNRMIEYKGQLKCITEWSEILNIPEPALRGRIFKCNWSIEKAFNTPLLFSMKEARKKSKLIDKNIDNNINSFYTNIK